ncbi:Maf family protein [Hansschlegelia beijingensis]
MRLDRGRDHLEGRRVGAFGHLGPELLPDAIHPEPVAGQRKRRILPKAETPDEAGDCLRLLSGRAHRVSTAICLVTRRGGLKSRLIETRLRFKRLSEREIESYLASGEWSGKAGGYAIQGLAGSFVSKLSGSCGAVVGLPLHETAGLLAGEGYPLHAGWSAKT